MVLMGCMNKSHFASYKFKPSDVIEGLNRYFAESKAHRYLRVPLEIKNGEVKPGNYYVLRNIVFDVSTPKIKECGYYYLICDPEEVIGVAINWLREEHGIFYTPGMNEPPIKDPDDIFRMENLKETKNFSITIDDFCVDDAAKEYEKETRKNRIEELQESRRDLIEALQRRLYEAKRRIVALEEGHKEKSKIIDRLREKTAEQQKKIDSYESTLSKITDIMEPKYAGPAWSETWDDLVERIKRMKEKVEMLEVAKTDCGLCLKIEELEEQLRVLRYDILKVYREIFDCSNGDPEGTDEEVMQDILTEYKRVLELKNVAEEKTIKYKELARENEENLAREREWTKKMGHKLIEIQDICER